MKDFKSIANSLVRGKLAILLAVLVLLLLLLVLLPHAMSWGLNRWLLDHGG